MLDAKAIQIFAAASVVLGFGTFTAATINAVTAILYAVAAGSYFIVGWKTMKVLATRKWRVTDGADRWWPDHGPMDTTNVRNRLLDDLASAFAENREHLNAKGELLNALLVFAAVETLFVALAVIGSLV
jgi:uncharacterized protein HemX